MTDFGSLISEVFYGRCKDLGLDSEDVDFDSFATSFQNGVSDPNCVILRSMRLGMNAIMALVKGLKRAPIRVLDLYGNLMRDVGAMAVFQLVRLNSHIKMLTVGGNGINAEGALALAQELPYCSQLEGLSLGESGMPSTEQFEPNGFSGRPLQLMMRSLRELDNLRHLSLNGISLADRGMKSLKQLCAFLVRKPTMQFLSLRGCEISSEGMAILCRSLVRSPSRLVYLDVSHNRLGFECADAISTYLASESSVCLHSLKLSHNPLGDQTIAGIIPGLRHSSLITLDLSATEIGDFGLERLTPALPASLVFLYFENNRFSTSAFVDLLEMSRLRPTLAFLSLSQSAIPGPLPTRQLARALERTHLRQVHLQRCKLHTSVLAAVSRMIEVSPIKILDLRHNFIGEDAAAAFLGEMRSLSKLHWPFTLQSLHLSGNQLSHSVVHQIEALLKKSRVAQQNEPLQMLQSQIHLMEYHAQRIPEVTEVLAETRAILDKRSEEIALDEQRFQMERDSDLQAVAKLRQDIDIELRQVQSLEKEIEERTVELEKVKIEAAQATDRVREEMEEEKLRLKDEQTRLEIIRSEHEAALPGIEQARERLKAEVERVEKVKKDLNGEIFHIKEELRKHHGGMSPAATPRFSSRGSRPLPRLTPRTRFEQ